MRGLVPRPRAPARRALVLVGVLLAVSCKDKAERVRRTSTEAPVAVVTTDDRPRRLRTDVVEREPNDTEPQEVAAGAFVRGRLESISDVDRYRLAVTAAGALTATTSAVPGVDLIVELRDPVKPEPVLAKSDRGGAAVDEGVVGFFVSPGAYEVVVRAFVKPKSTKGKAAPAPEPAPAPLPPYELELSVAAPPSGGEIEPNFDGGTASELAIGEPSSGLVGWSGDVDVWKVGTEVLAESNSLDFAVTGVEGLALALELRDGLGKPIAKRKGIKGQALAVRGWSAGAASTAPPFLYVAISADRSHPTLAYQLSATARAAESDEEREGNDRAELAQALPEAGAVVRATLDAGDVDCFSIPAVAAARRVEVAVDLPGVGAGSTAAPMNVVVELLLGDKVIASSDGPAGQSERVLTEIPGGKTAVVRVRGAAKPGEPGGYTVSWTEAAADAMPPEEGTEPAR